MERNNNMENSSIFMKKAAPPKNLFSDFSNYKSKHEYNSARNSIQVCDSNKDDKKSSKNVVYFTIKSRQKNDIKENKTHQRNQSQLPEINERSRQHLVTKYFNRNDIVKDRAEQRARNNQTFNNNKDKFIRNASIDLNDRQLSKYMLNSNDCFISNGHLMNIKKFKQLQPLSAKVNGCNTHKYTLKKYPLYRNQSLVHLNRKQKLADRRSFNEHYGSIQDEMHQWEVIKRKNEFQMYKMKRKNDLQRMKSNFIIAQALNQLIDKKQRVLLDEEFQQLKLNH